MRKCDYFECPDEVCAEDKEIDASMHFCQKHYDELRKLLESENFSPKAVVGFWVMAKGGAKRAAKAVLG